MPVKEYYEYEDKDKYELEWLKNKIFKQGIGIAKKTLGIAGVVM